MSKENVELVRSGYAEPDALTALSARISPDAEFDFTAVYPDRPVLRGLDEMQWFRDTGPWSGSPIHFEPERFFDVDDERVLVFVRVTAQGEGSGVPVEIRNAHELTLRDGLLVRFKVYRDRAQGVEAAGLGE
jgi:ketosteroid isomerase-like protein